MRELLAWRNPRGLRLLVAGGAALGALLDPRVGEHERQVIINLGNMHVIGFYLRGRQIVGLFEHHTDQLDAEQIVRMAEQLVEGSLDHNAVYDSLGHGALYTGCPSGTLSEAFVAVTGAQRGMLRGSRLRPYFAAPHGDTVISGCFGLVQAFAERYPASREEILAALTAST